MKFIKRFELYLESVNNIKKYNGFTIRYNHTKNHDLNKKLYREKSYKRYQ